MIARPIGLLAGLALLLVSPRALASDAATVKRSCDKAGNWLIEQHNLAEGTFGKSKLSKEPGVVGLVLKALCDSPRGYREAHGPFITMPVKYVLKTQKGNGAFAMDGRDTYNTALAIVGLETVENSAYKPQIAIGREYLAKCQGKEGGFTYGDGFRDGGDLSNTWFGLFGLKGGKVSSDTHKAALDFIRRCQDNPETNPELAAKKGDGTGGAYYKPGGSEAGTYKTRSGADMPKPYGSMTAAALEAYLLCGLTADAPEVKAALGWFKKNFSAKENPGAGMQGYFYYAFAASRALHAAGIKELELADGTKVQWASALAEQLLALQDKGAGESSMAGSFVNKEARWMEDDPVLTTAYALSALNQCYKVLKTK